MLPPHLHKLPAESVDLERLLHQRSHLLQIDRLAQVMERPQSHGLHGRLYGAMGRHDNHGHGIVDLAQALDELQPAHVRHEQIGQHQIRHLASFDGLEHGHRTEKTLGPVAIPAQNRTEKLPDLGFVVDDENGRFHNSPHSPSMVTRCNGKPLSQGNYRPSGANP